MLVIATAVTGMAAGCVAGEVSASNATLRHAGFVEWTIASLPNGPTAYTVPTAMRLYGRGDAYLDPAAPVSSVFGGPMTLRVARVDGKYHVSESLTVLNRWPDRGLPGPEWIRAEIHPVGPSNA